MQKKFKPKRRAVVITAGTCALATFLFAAAFPARRFLRIERYYYSAAVLIIAWAFAALVVSFEKKRPSSRELVVLASATALAIASRAAFCALPQIKPLCSVVVAAAASLGPQAGFACGALAMFASNFIFGQGPLTPFQTLAMGLVGLLAGIIFHNRRARKNRFLLSAAGGFLCLTVYGAIVDGGFALTVLSEFSFKRAAAIYISGAPFNLIHAASTAAVLFVAGEAVIEILDGMKIKYGMFGGTE